MSNYDVSFIDRLKNEDMTSFETVVRDQTSVLYKACIGLGFQSYEADDLIQSV